MGLAARPPQRGKARPDGRGIAPLILMKCILLAAITTILLKTWTDDIHYDQHLHNLVMSDGMPDGSAGSTRAAWPPPPGCAASPRPRIALIMVVVGWANNPTLHDAYWVSVGNRRVFALEHGYPLYLVTEELGTGQHPSWEKFVALQAVFQHSCVDWAWVADADAYVMNVQRSVESIVDHPLTFRHPHRGCNTSTPDVIIAGACLTHMNGGSVLWRNSAWARQHMAEAWHSKYIARPFKWWEQAALLHLYKQAEVRPHYCIVTQHTLNVFPNMTRCHDGTGTYKPGDLLVHFPGGMKIAITSLASRWLQEVPLTTSRPELMGQRVAAWIISPFNGHSAPHGRHIHVTLNSSHSGLSHMPTDMDLIIEPQMEGFDNLGWPIVRPIPLEARGPAAAAAEPGSAAAPAAQHGGSYASTSSAGASRASSTSSSASSSVSGSASTTTTSASSRQGVASTSSSHGVASSHTRHLRSHSSSQEGHSHSSQPGSQARQALRGHSSQHARGHS